MKNITYKTVIVVFLCNAILWTGCTKDLDLSPKAQISDASFWISASDFEKAANALYASLEGFPSTTDFNMFDVNSDIAFNSPNSVSNSTMTTPDTDGKWNTPYTYIRRCNNLIEHAQVSSIAESVKVYVAEARFFRAYNYWSLYRLYGGVPIVTKVLDIDSPELFDPRNSADEVVDYILNDLRDAVADLPEEDQVPAASKGRITKGAANGLRARVALFEGTWRKYRSDADATKYLDIALESSNAVINSGKYTLFSQYGADESYRLLFIDEGDNASECILDRIHASRIGSALHYMPPRFQQYGMLATKTLADMYLCTDGLPVEKSPLFQGYETRTSEFENRDGRMSQTIMIPGTIYYAHYVPAPVPTWPFYPQRNNTTGYIQYKYLPQNQEMLMFGDGSGVGHGYDRHIIRYAEILLIFAEATFEKNGSISDGDLDRTINLLRERVGMPTKLSNAFVTANGLDMKEEIRRERTVELAFEGLRWDDLRRWKTAEIELKKPIKGIKVLGTEWIEPILVSGENANPYGGEYFQNRTDENGFIISESSSATIRGSFNPEKHYLYPLPAKELQKNTNLKQNPNW